MELLKFIRDRGMTNSQVCEKAGIGESTLSQFMSGKRKGLNLDTACKIADSLGITLDEFRKITERGDDSIE